MIFIVAAAVKGAAGGDHLKSEYHVQKYAVLPRLGILSSPH